MESLDPKKVPLPLFDSLEHIDKALLSVPAHAKPLGNDYLYALAFLKSYKGSAGTFNSYRREVERLLQWTHHVVGLSLADVKRVEMEAYITFCQDPPKSWIGLKKVPRFFEQDNARSPNPEWRPFVATLSKVAHRQGKQVNIDSFQWSQGSMKELFAILSTFFNFLIQEEYLSMNPVALIRQKSKYIRKQQGREPIRRLSTLQWAYVIETVEIMAAENPDQHERSFFMMTLLYSMYCRISELAASKRWTPKMSDFFRDGEGNWWFKTVGKGNKERQIAVSDATLQALVRYRRHLGLSTYPSAADQTPLFSKLTGKGPITSTTYLREMVQICFDRSIQRLEADHHREEAEALNEATVHWLRHTGISDDVKHRPREHVRDDAGHSSSMTTDRYIDVELKARHQSAKHKPLISDN